MKRNTDVLFAGALCVALLWWGAMFPSLLLNEDTVCVLNEQGEVIETIEVMQQIEGVPAWKLLLEAEEGQIVCKSKLFTLCKEYLDEVTDNDDT